MPQFSGFDAKSSATSPEERWWSYHVLKLVYCVKNCSCVKISENVLVFGHYAINLRKGVSVGNRVKVRTLEQAVVFLCNFGCPRSDRALANQMRDRYATFEWPRRDRLKST